MKRALCLLGLSVLLFTLVGCAAGYYVAPVHPGGGWAFARVDAPLSIYYKDTPVCEKKGQASVENFLGLIALGDASIEAAAKEGGLRKVHYADYKFFNILGLYSKFTTIAYGE